MKKRQQTKITQKGNQHHSKIRQEEEKDSLQQEYQLKQLQEAVKQQELHQQQKQELSQKHKHQSKNTRPSFVQRMSSQEDAKYQQMKEDDNYSNNSQNTSDNRLSDMQLKQSMNDMQNLDNSADKLNQELLKQEASMTIHPYQIYIFSKLFEYYSLTHQCYLSKQMQDQIYSANDQCFEMVLAQHELSNRNDTNDSNQSNEDYQKVILSSVKNLLEKMKYQEINVDSCQSEKQEQYCSSHANSYAVFKQTADFIQGPQGSICNSQLSALSSGLEIRLEFSKGPQIIQKNEDLNEKNENANDRESTRKRDKMDDGKSRYQQQEEFLKQFSENHPFDESMYLKVQVRLLDVSLIFMQEEGIQTYFNILNFQSRDIQYLFNRETKSVAFSGIIYLEEEFLISRILVQIDKLIASLLQMLDYFHFLQRGRLNKNIILLEPIRLGFALDRTFKAIEDQSKILLA